MYIIVSKLIIYRTLRDPLTDIPGGLLQLSNPELSGARNQVQDLLQFLLPGRNIPSEDIKVSL